MGQIEHNIIIAIVQFVKIVKIVLPICLRSLSCHIACNKHNFEKHIFKTAEAIQ